MTKRLMLVFTMRPSAVFSIHTSIGGGALGVIFYFLVDLLGPIFSSAQTAANFAGQDIFLCINYVLYCIRKQNYLPH